jgi:hypothetical protein
VTFREAALAWAAEKPKKRLTTNYQTPSRAVRATRPIKAVNKTVPPTRLAMTFRDLALDGAKDWRNWVVFAQFAADDGDEDARAVIDCFRKLKPREKNEVSPEYVCDLAGVKPADLAAQIFRMVYIYAGDAAALIEAAARPAVVQKTVNVALTDEGWRDRQMLHQHSGFLPRPGGSNISVNASANVQSAMFSPAHELPSVEVDTMRFTKALKDGKVIEGEAVEIESSPVAALGAGRDDG